MKLLDEFQGVIIKTHTPCLPDGDC